MVILIISIFQSFSGIRNVHHLLINPKFYNAHPNTSCFVLPVQEQYKHLNELGVLYSSGVWGVGMCLSEKHFTLVNLD